MYTDKEVTDFSEALIGLQQNTVKIIKLQSSGIIPSVRNFNIALKKNTSLETLEIGKFFQRQLSGSLRELFCNLFEILASHPAIKKIDISAASFSQVENSGAISMVSFLQKNKTIQIFKLNDCGFQNPNTFQQIAQAIEQHPSLESITLGGQRVGNEGAKAIAKMLKNNTQLRHIGLGNAQIGDEGIESIAEALTQNKTLRSIRLIGNPFGVKGIQALISALQKNPSLIKIDDLDKMTAISEENKKTLMELLKRNKEDSEEIVIIKPPSEYCCPITHDIMLNPVSTQCGHTFEESAIKQWFENNLQCPCCKKAVDDVLATNFSLKSLVTSFIQNNPQCTHKEFFTACERGDPKEIRRCIALGAKLEARKEGMTPLHRATVNGNKTVVLFLLQHKANANASDTNGRTPLHNIVDEAMMQLLIDHGASIDTKDNRGDTPLHLAAYFGDYKKVIFLVEHGAALEAKGSRGETSLHYAALAGHDAIAQYLIMEGANTKALNDESKTPAQIAEENDHTSTALAIVKTYQQRKQLKLKAVKEVDQLKIRVDSLEKKLMEQQKQIKVLLEAQGKKEAVEAPGFTFFKSDS